MQHNEWSLISSIILGGSSTLTHINNKRKISHNVVPKKQFFFWQNCEKINEISIY